MRKQLSEIELVEVDGQVLTVRRHYDNKGFLQESLSTGRGEVLSETNSRKNGFGILGSVRTWVAYHKATKELRKSRAEENLRLAENQAERMLAQDTLDVIRWGEQFERECKGCMDGETPILGFWG